MPPMTLPNMMPTSGTITTSLNWTRWMNQTKIQVPSAAVTKANAARPSSVDPGMNSRASRMPNWADEMVAPVVGDTNLFIQSACMMRPATLMPTPVHRMASRRGRRERTKMRICSKSPESTPCTVTSSTPTNRDATPTASRRTARTTVERWLRSDAGIAGAPPRSRRSVLGRSAAHDSRGAPALELGQADIGALVGPESALFKRRARRDEAPGDRRKTPAIADEPRRGIRRPLPARIGGRKRPFCAMARAPFGVQSMASIFNACHTRVFLVSPIRRCST